MALDFEKAMAKSMWLLAILNKNPPNLAFLFQKYLNINRLESAECTLDPWSGFKIFKKVSNTFKPD